MMTIAIHYCSYFDHRYLARALCLYDSLCAHSPPFVWHVLALSDECEQLLRKLDLPHVEVTSLSKLEATKPELLVAKGNRSIVEYYFTVTSGYCQYLIEKLPVDCLLTYLDSDLYFFDSPEPVLKELEQASVGIIEHRFTKVNQDKIKYGRFNVGWVTFRNDLYGRACLGDWYEKCLDWCYDRLEATRFADQKYLDRWPSEFEGVHIIEHLGANVGPWNVADFPLKSVRKTSTQPVAIDNTPLIFAHFQYVRRLGLRTFETGLGAYQVDCGARKQIVHQMYYPYLQHLQKREASIAKLDSQLSYSGGSTLRHEARVLDSYRPGDLLRFPFKYFSMIRSHNWVTVW
jgi:hypothetical protein